MIHNDPLVILVDENDNEIGTMGKIKAHEEGALHRAFSVLIFNDKNDILLQQRAFNKYHCGGLWTNTCCSHPKQGEALLASAQRRLKEEMGIDVPLQKSFDFIYKASFDNGLTEYEFDHVFTGCFSEVPDINTNEVANWKYISYRNLKKDIAKNPDDYTPWFKIIIERIDKAG